MLRYLIRILRKFGSILRADWREYDICVAFVNTRWIGLFSILAAAAVHQSQCQEVKYRKNEDYQ